MEKNIFFNVAIKQAARLLGRKKRLLMLIARLGAKVKDVKWSEVKSADVKDKLSVIGRLVKAYALGHYRAIPWKPLLMITGAILYFVSPLDSIPDLIPVLGFTDDVGILLAVYHAVHLEIDKFITWEKSQFTPGL